MQRVPINVNIDKNLEFIKVKYNSMINSDIIIREFNVSAKGEKYKAFLVGIDGMVNSDLLNRFLLQPLMNNNDYIDAKDDLADYMFNLLIPQVSISKSEDFEMLIRSINGGSCVLFVDTLSIAFIVENKAFASRPVSPPTNETIIRGSQEAFVENVRTNTSLLRKIVNNENFITETIEVGTITHTGVAVCYMKNITNDDLVAEVKYRINNLEIDYILSSGQLEQLIDDDLSSPFPQMLATERPDKAGKLLLEGRVVVFVNGSPYSLIMPAVISDFLTSPEDTNLKAEYSNLLRFIRFFAAVITLLLPGIYVAITNYHSELLPTELLFTMASDRESVPFPVIFEILLMEISFELIRESGLRVPSLIGPTIGIVGALVLGNAAVAAHLVSPILIIIVAITGICSFAIPDYSMGFALRIFRFMFIIMGFLAGFLGIASRTIYYDGCNCKPAILWRAILVTICAFPGSRPKFCIYGASYMEKRAALWIFEYQKTCNSAKDKYEMEKSLM
ncbi:MAG: spore germination protein [Firmicutes bacterium]|nr:spore germination protein [Bacillota bacterium]